MIAHKDSGEIPIIKPARAKRRKRTGHSPKQIRQAIEVLRLGMEPQVTFKANLGEKAFEEMAIQAVAYCRAAMLQAMVILEGEK